MDAGPIYWWRARSQQQRIRYPALKPLEIDNHSRCRSHCEHHAAARHRKICPRAGPGCSVVWYLRAAETGAVHRCIVRGTRRCSAGKNDVSRALHRKSYRHWNGQIHHVRANRHERFVHNRHKYIIRIDDAVRGGPTNDKNPNPKALWQSIGFRSSCGCRMLCTR